jgi:4-hydroxybenzoate polyprenyltransferase
MLLQLKYILKTMRPRQWSKNVFFFAALVFDHKLSLNNFQPALRTLAGFVLFCLISGAVYIVNDLLDVQADRSHPTKRNRPIASGKLAPSTALLAAGILLTISLVAAYLLSIEFCLVAATYFLINIAYSTWLKHISIVDVFIIAAGFVLRVAGGALVISSALSPWLFVCMSLLSLFLALGKRRAELATLMDEASTTRRALDGYTLPFLDQLITIVLSTTILAYSLYTFYAPNVPANQSMMLSIPFVVYAIFRYLYLIQVEKKGEAPEDLLLTDHPFQIAIFLWVVSVIIVFYLLK